ncbi:arginine:ornithine antiporter / lysine permease [Pilibacter termitis]|uniref:Arginine-ornithine antiporter n=1 Tax=Pilibacter termitis TaxID=263852 RepID=A0A1T4L5A9_9ENTE|nr:arginine-ornithine antiporter [Pilibacter termitis]SJZ49700.1 arginine:ornithine antiporter / lysine permease [Pilibacter termitis]
MEKKHKGISKIGLVAAVVSSSIGSGVFGITSDLAAGSAPAPAMIAWVIVGIGILALVLSLNNLGAKHPEMNAGIFGYAEKDFGKLGGFISGWGYWMSSWLGNVAFATMFMSAVGEFFPLFKGGQNVPSILLASLFIWGLTFLVSGGLENASIVNVLVMLCKLVPLVFFLIMAILSFKLGIFTSDFWGNVAENLQNNGTAASVGEQIKSCLMVMMWVFVGIEGASVLASRAEKRSDAQKASIIGLTILLFIYILASLLPFGVLSQEELANIKQPAMANILKHIVGDWGAAFINIGLIISVIGAWLSWTMLPAETTMLMARDKLLPKFFGKTNEKNSPTNSLIATATLTNLFLLTFLVTDYAYKLAYSLCTASILICYLFVAIYQIKYSFKQKEPLQLGIGIVATLFQIVGITLAGFNYVLLCSIAYIPGLFFFLKACHANNRNISTLEKAAMILITLSAILAIVMLYLGMITL